MLRRVEPTPAGCAQLFGALFDNTASGFCVQLDFSRNNLSRASKVCHLLINYSSDPTTVFSIILLWFSCLCSSVEPTPLASLSLSRPLSARRAPTPATLPPTLLPCPPLIPVASPTESPLGPQSTYTTPKWNYAGADSCVATLASAIKAARRVPLAKLLLEECRCAP
jgi:hypothetical protein